MRPGDVIASAMRWVGRGQSYPALCREIAWTAARSTAADGADLDRLAALVDRRLAECIDHLPDVVRAAAVQAEVEHLDARPHDGDGAELVAALAAEDAAIEYLSTAYLDALDWTVGVLRAGQAAEADRARRRRRRSRQRPPDEPVPCEVPQRILDGLERRATKPGWRDRRAA